MGITFEINFADITVPSGPEVCEAVARQFPKLRCIHEMVTEAWPYNETYIFYLDPTKAYNIEIEHQFPNNFQVRITEQSVAVLHTVALAFVGFLWGFTEYVLPVLATNQGAEFHLDTWEAFIDFNYKLQASVKGARSINERQQRTVSSSSRTVDLPRSVNPAAALSPHLLRPSPRQRRPNRPGNVPAAEKAQEWADGQLRASSPVVEPWRPVGSQTRVGAISGGGFSGGGGRATVGRRRDGSPIRQRSSRITTAALDGTSSHATATELHLAATATELALDQTALIGEPMSHVDLDGELQPTQCPWGSKAASVTIGPDGLPIFPETLKPGEANILAERRDMGGATGDDPVGNAGKRRASASPSRRRQADRVDKGRYTASVYNEQISRPGAVYDEQKAMEYIELLRGELSEATQEQQFLDENTQAYCSRIAPGLQSGTLVTDWEDEHQRSAEAAVLQLPEPGQDGVVMLTEQQKRELISKLSDFRSSPRALHRLKAQPKPRERSPGRCSTLRKAAGSSTARSHASATTVRSTSVPKTRARSPSPQRKLAQSDIKTMVGRLSQPSARANEDSYRRRKKAGQNDFSGKDNQKKSFVNERSREMVQHITPIQDRSQMIMNKKKAWIEEQQKQKATEVEASFSKPEISTAASKKKRTVADLMRWQAKKLDNRKTGAEEKAKQESSTRQEPKYFNSRCSEIMSTERLYLGNK